MAVARALGGRNPLGKMGDHGTQLRQTGTANVLSRLMLGTSRHLLTVVESGGEVQCKLRILATVGHMNLASAASPATL
jgi:hypothetical protein